MTCKKEQLDAFHRNFMQQCCSHFLLAACILSMRVVLVSESSAATKYKALDSFDISWDVIKKIHVCKGASGLTGLIRAHLLNIMWNTAGLYASRLETGMC